MSRFKKVLSGLVIVGALGLATLAIAISHDSPCAADPAPRAGATLMKAAVRYCYGPSTVVHVDAIEKPTPADNQVLVKVRAASVNPLDWHYLHGMPYIARFDAGFGKPGNPQLGVDYAGVVEAVGKDVGNFHPGDEVFGGRFGALAEYLAVRADRNIVIKPANVSFEEAAAVPIAAITALQAVRDKGHVAAGQKVLINGASGGVGTYAVQIAKVLGADVTAVCSARNAELVRAIGADHVIDYATTDYTAGDTKYDVIIDNVATHGLLDNRRAMTPTGTYVVVGGAGKAEDGKWIGAMDTPLYTLMIRPFIKQDMRFFLADLNPADLKYLADLMQQGRIKSVIDRKYPLEQAAEALRYLEEGHARGKVVVTMGGNPGTSTATRDP